MTLSPSRRVLGAFFATVLGICTGVEGAQVEKFLEFLAERLPKQGSIEATYVQLSDGHRRVVGFDIPSGHWYWVSPDGLGGCCTPAGDVFAIHHGASLKIAEGGPFSGRPSIDKAIEPFFPSIFLLDVLNRGLVPSELRVRDQGGFTATFEFPQGERAFVGRARVGELPLKQVTIEIDTDGHMMLLRREGMPVDQRFTYSKDSPPGFPVAMETFDPRTGEVVFALEAVTYHPNGDLTLFTTSAVESLYSSVRALDIERRRMARVSENSSAEQHSALSRQISRQRAGVSWWLVWSGLGLLGLTGIVLVRRHAVIV